jgi:hypothetical protein
MERFLWFPGHVQQSSTALQGEYLKVNAAMQRTLAEAIAQRTGTEVERGMLPMILAGAVTAATQVALRQHVPGASPGPSVDHAWCGV